MLSQIFKAPFFLCRSTSADPSFDKEMKSSEPELRSVTSKSPVDAPKLVITQSGEIQMENYEKISKNNNNDSSNNSVVKAHRRRSSSLDNRFNGKNISYLYLNN